MNIIAYAMALKMLSMLAFDVQEREDALVVVRKRRKTVEKMRKTHRARE